MTATAAQGLRGCAIRRVGLALATVICAACPQRTAVWVTHAPNAIGPVLHVSDVRGGTRPVEIGGVRVDPCGHEAAGDGAMWVVGPRVGTAATRELAYGVAPAGWESVQGPKPLTPGCYQVTISGTGRAIFDVHRDGAIAERSE